MQIWARIEKRNRRHLGRMGNIKKAQHHKYHDSEESRKEMDVEKPKRCSEDRNWLHFNKQARHRHIRNNNQQSQHWKWPQNSYKQHQSGRRGGKEIFDDQEATKSRYYKIGVNNSEFQLEVDIDIIQYIHVMSSQGNQQVIDIEDTVTNTSPDDETARNGWKRRQ